MIVDDLQSRFSGIVCAMPFSHALFVTFLLCDVHSATYALAQFCLSVCLSVGGYNDHILC